MNTKNAWLVLPITMVMAVTSIGLGRSPSTLRANRWPWDPALVLKRLNSWDKVELDVAERPQAHRGRVASGETNGWIGSHKSTLNAIGYTVRWNPSGRRYLMKDRAAGDWHEKNPSAYLGRYETAVFVDDDPADRAAGRGGGGAKVKASIELGKRGGRLVATYRIAPADRSKRATTAQLRGVKIRANQIMTEPVVIKTAWPYYLPERFEGRFVKPRGLIFGGRLFRRVGSK